MTPVDGSGGPAAWQEPRLEESPLRRYADTLRERGWLILAVTLATAAVALVYVLAADRVYQAEAKLLVTPVSNNDPTLAGLGTIRESSDPTRDVETAAQLVASVDVAKRVGQRLSLSEKPADLLQRVDVQPVAQSNIVTITAEAEGPKQAQTLADAFAVATVVDRTEQFHSQLDRSIARLRKTVRGFPDGQNSSDSSPAARLAALEALRGGDDPTIRVETLAEAPTAPARPKPLLSIVAGLLAGLALGLGTAFGLQVLDPRLRREKQLRERYSLPILARVPNTPTTGRHPGPLALERLAPSAGEAYRTLRATIGASYGDRSGSRAILVTSASQSEGKTTSAINLASSLALAGNRVILIEADLRRPALGGALGEKASLGTDSVLIDQATLEESLIETRAYGSYLKLLLAEESGYASGWMADRLFLPTARNLIENAKGLADYVVIDSPPLSEVIDALPLAQQADDVLIVARLAETHLTKLTQLGELLARHGITPTGFVLVGVSAPRGSGYYYVPDQSRRRGRGSRSGSPRWETNGGRVNEPRQTVGLRGDDGDSAS